jgi:hypothetical protein
MFFVVFEVLTAVIVKSFVFRDIMSYNPFKVNRPFGRTYDLRFKIKPKKKKPAFCLFNASFVLGLLFSLKTVATVPPKRRITYSPVGIAARLWFGWPWEESGARRDFSLLRSAHTSSVRPPSLLSDAYRELFLRYKWPGLEANHLPPSGAEVSYAWSCTPTYPYGFMALCTIFTFFILFYWFSFILFILLFPLLVIYLCLHILYKT